jgi:hypothetical protein
VGLRRDVTKFQIDKTGVSDGLLRKALALETFDTI